MPVSINNTTLTFNDATTQTTSGVTSVSAGTGISVAGGKTPTVTNTGVTSVAAGSGISVSASTGSVTISASGGGVTSLNGQTGAITNTDLGAIGSTGYFYYAGTSNLVGNNTTSGSNLYYSTSITEIFENFWKTQSGDPNRCDASPGAITRYTAGNTGFQPPTAASNLSGTWRVMNAIPQRFSSYNGETETKSRCWQVVATRVS